LQIGKDRRKSVDYGPQSSEGTDMVNTAMADMFDFISLGSISRWSRRGAAVLMLAAATITGAAAQNVVAFVNGEPITALDIEQRSKLDELATHKPPPRQDVLDELINDKLKVKEGKRWGIEPSDADIDSAFGTMGGRMHMNADQFGQALTKGGINPNTLKSRIRADMVWQSLVRGRYSASLEVGEKDVLAEMIAKKSEDDGAGSYEYTLRPILFLVPPGSPDTVYEERKRDAETLRNRFRSCDEGLPFARALNGVVVRDQIVRNSADVPAELRKGLDSVPVGQLTSPDVTKLGVELFAICSKTESKADNSPGKRQAREAAFAEKFEQQSKRYLDDLRHAALIEYK